MIWKVDNLKSREIEIDMPFLEWYYKKVIVRMCSENVEPFEERDDEYGRRMGEKAFSLIFHKIHLLQGGDNLIYCVSFVQLFFEIAVYNQGSKAGDEMSQDAVLPLYIYRPCLKIRLHDAEAFFNLPAALKNILSLSFLSSSSRISHIMPGDPPERRLPCHSCEVTVCCRGKPCIGADDKPGHVKLFNHFSFKGNQGVLLIVIPGGYAESNRDAVRVHEQPHFHDGEREALFLNRRLCI